MKLFKKFPLRTIYVLLNALSVGSFLVLLYFTNNLMTQFRESNHTLRSIGMLTDAITELRRLSAKPERLQTAREAVSHVPTLLAAFEQKKIIQKLEKIQTEILRGVDSTTLSNSLADLSHEVTALRMKHIARYEARMDLLSVLLLRVSLLIICLIVIMSYYGTKVAKADEIIKEQQIQMANGARMSALGEMAGGISHEINNPLGFILGYTEQIESAIRKNPIDTDKILKKTDIIKTTCERVAKIVKGLKSMARDGAKDPVVSTSVKKIIEDVCTLCENTLKRRQIRFETEGDFDRLVISCREVQIGQVLINLINNARDAIEENEEKWIRLSVKEEERIIQFSITDSGKGIPKEIQGKILKPFFTTKPAGDGTGLGLSISVAIATAHRGRLFLDTESKNTRFVLQIPKGKNSAMEDVAA